MKFLIAARSDVGPRKKTNQDSLTVLTAETSAGPLAFAVLCDGMGGLALGEVASAAVVDAFSHWLKDVFSQQKDEEVEDGEIRRDWDAAVSALNTAIRDYGKSQGVTMGTTVTVLLLTQTRYYILNVGDTRAYVLGSALRQITADQTVLAHELAVGHITEEEAKTDPRGSVLLQCVGASNEVRPDFFFGTPQVGETYFLCSDGFRHLITPEELYAALGPQSVRNSAEMGTHLEQLIASNLQRGEVDNISGILIKTI